MSNLSIFVLVVLAAVLCVIVFGYLHKRHKEYRMADIGKAVKAAYPDGVNSIAKLDLVKSLKQYFHCSSKEAHYIIGVARRKKLIDIEAGSVTLL